MSAAAGTRPVPTSLANWAGVSDLLPDFKLLLFLLWSSPSPLVSVIGVGGPGTIERLTSSTRFDEPVVLEALRELDRRGLVVLDEETREVAIRRWVKFHNFTGRWAKVAEESFGQVQSAKIKSVLVQQEGLKAIFPTKSTPQTPNSNSNSNSNKEIPPERGGGAAPPPNAREARASRERGALKPKARTYATTPEGVWYEPGNERDLDALTRIPSFPEELRRAAIRQAAERDPHGRAFASAVLRAIWANKGGGASAAERAATMDEWLDGACKDPVEAAATASTGEVQTMDGTFEEVF